MPNYTEVDPYAASRGFNQMVQLGQQRREFDASEQQLGLDNENRNRLAALQGEQAGMQRQTHNQQMGEGQFKATQQAGLLMSQALSVQDPAQRRATAVQAIQANPQLFDSLGIPSAQQIEKINASDDATLQASLEAIAKFAQPGDGQKIGAFQPGDYTPESFAKFQKSGNSAELQRYAAPQRDFSPNFQNVTRTHPDGSTEMGAFNTRTSQYDWSGQRIPAGTKARVDAEGKSIGDAAGDRQATLVKNTRAYDTFATAMGNIAKSMDETPTGPLVGRSPAFTADQQTAEGAISIAIPTMKELFRTAGEGTFTEGDQKVLTDMIPTRKDHPEARKAKLEMIDALVRSKTGLKPRSPGGGDGGSGRTPTFATEAEAEAAGLKPGTKVIVGGRPATWQ